MNGDGNASWSSFLTNVEPTHRVSTGNRLTHLRDEDRAVRAIWRAIDEAGERVWVSMYILAPDRVGHTTIERLAHASARGCDVRLLYDGVGSIRLRRRHLAPLEAAGASMRPSMRAGHRGSARDRSGSAIIRSSSSSILRPRCAAALI